MEDIRNKVEALLFSSGKRIGVEQLCRLIRMKDAELVKAALQQMKQEYDEKSSPLMLIEEGDAWKLTVRERYLPLVRKIGVETELSKTIIETLAIIAWRAPVLQSDVIKLRTNKAYDHITELESAGFLSREKQGRTQLIKLTQKFLDYFDLQGFEDMKQKFQSFKNSKLAKAEAAEQEQLNIAASGNAPVEVPAEHVSMAPPEAGQDTPPAEHEAKPDEKVPAEKDDASS